MQYFSCCSDKYTEIKMCDLEPFSKIQSHLISDWLGNVSCSKSSRDFNRRPIKSSAGGRLVAMPVVEWRVIGYLKRNFISFSATVPCDILRRPCLNVCTTLSASPLVDG